MNTIGWTLTSGLLLGAGATTIAAIATHPRESLLERRLAGMLPDGRAEPRTGRLRGIPERIGTRMASMLGTSADVAARMERAGLRPDVEAFRASQALWGMVALLAAAVLIAVSSATEGTSPVSAVGLLLICAASGVIAKDQLLSHAAAARERQMLAEFPTVADMLALAVAAGQGPLGALEHVTKLCHGPLAHELSRALSAASSGVALSEALAAVARRTSLVPVSRFIDGMIVALERGTPLSDVLRAQAQDAREAARGALIESAGRKEVLMMAPIVFLTLPVTIVFAVFPGILALDLTL